MDFFLQKADAAMQAIYLKGAFQHWERLYRRAIFNLQRSGDIKPDF